MLAESDVCNQFTLLRRKLKSSLCSGSVRRNKDEKISSVQDEAVDKELQKIHYRLPVRVCFL